MRIAELKTDGTLYRAEPWLPIQPYERTDGSVVVKLVNLDSAEAPRGHYREEKKPIKAEIVSTAHHAGLKPGDTVFLSARRVLRTEEKHQERVRHAQLAQERFQRELAERNAQHEITEKNLRGELERLGIGSLFQTYRDFFRGGLSVTLASSPEALLDSLRKLTREEN